MNSAEDYAQLLRTSATSKIPVPPISQEIGALNVELAYEIQNINSQIRINNGASLVGKKIGLTSFEVQKQIGVDQPDYGILFNDMEILNGQSVSWKDLMQPKAEAEVAFVLNKTLDQNNMTIVDVMRAIDFVLPAIEIPGSRIADWKITLSDTIADNASASHYVLGSQPVRLENFDSINCGMKLIINGEQVSTGKGSNCLGSPLNAVHWLANKMLEIGNPLRKGELILSGALGKFVDIKPGDHIVTHIDGMGPVEIEITE